MPPQYHADYEARYYADPAKRAQRAANARKRYRDPRNKEKIEARLAVRRALESGTLHRQPCQDCGATHVEAHHPDYSLPLSVEWLCRKHHSERHPRVRKPAKGRPPLVMHCKRGHPYDAANTYHYRDRRRCRACNAIAVSVRRAKAAGA